MWIFFRAEKEEKEEKIKNEKKREKSPTYEEYVIYMNIIYMLEYLNSNIGGHWYFMCIYVYKINKCKNASFIHIDFSGDKSANKTEVFWQTCTKSKIRERSSTWNFLKFSLSSRYVNF